MVEKMERRSSECLKRWIADADYEILPTEKALSLVDLIPPGSNVRVTCRPTGIEDTVSFMERLEIEKAKSVTPHVAARRLRSESHFDQIMERLINAGSKNIFVVGGDGQPETKGFIKAEDVLMRFYAKGIRFENIGIGGYPEGNPLLDADPTEILLRKQEIAEMMGQEMEIVTQMCFDVDALYSWIRGIRRNGVYLPVVVGVPGQIKIDTLFKVLPTLGITDVMAFMKSKPRLAKCLTTGILGGFAPEGLLTELAEKNYPESGIKGISVFTLGSVSKSVQCLTDLANKT